MSEGTTQATQQSDWILPPAAGTNGLPNAVAVAVTTTAATVDLSTIPNPPIYDRSVSSYDNNPLGHYVNLQAQGADVFVLFGPTFASLGLNLVASVSVTGGGSGYLSAPTIGFTGGAGSAAAATATITGGAVTAITMTNNGGGYTSAPTVTFTGGSGSGAAATANLGGPPNTTTTNTVSASTGAVTMTRGPCAWIPQNQTLPVKLHVGSPAAPQGTNSPFRFMAYIAGSGTSATLRIWQSSP